MTNNYLKKIICILTVISMMAVFAGCSKSEEEETTELVEEISEEYSEEESETEAETETETETTTVPETTTVIETTTVADGSSIQSIIDTLESQVFYMSGQITINESNQTVDAKMNCSGDNYSLDMSTSQLNISILYIDGVPYIANNSTKLYVVIDDTAIDSMDQIVSSLSSMGISMSSTDVSDLKSMMENFDENMDYSQYIEDGEYSEYTSTTYGEEYLCSAYKTDYGTIRIYTDDGELKVIDVYDADGAMQMNFVVAAFIPQTVNPISLDGLTRTTSIMNLFTGS